MKKIILCADDYGQNQAISQGIITLFQLNRLSATSCLTTSPLWPAHATWLEPFKDQFVIGLHWNLTEGKPLTESGKKIFSPLKKLLLKSQLRSLNKKAIAEELNVQLDHFISAMGCLPKFIDGHQHIHQFPVIRDIILEIYQKRLCYHQVFIRSTFQPIKFKAIKNTIIQLSGANHFKKQLNKFHIPHNSSFGGIYSFQSSNKYSEIFPTFLHDIADGGIIMCHPGCDVGDNDAIAKARVDEFNYFSSEKFLRDCKEANVCLR